MISAYVLSGLVSLCVALCYAEFASMVPVAGSAYTYAYATLGELVAWIIGWDLILEYGLSLAPTASSLSDYFQHMLANVGIVFPAWAQTANVHGAHPQIDLFASHRHARGHAARRRRHSRIGRRQRRARRRCRSSSMLVFIVAVAHAIHPSNLHPFAPFGYHGVLASTALVFFAYIGFDTVTVASEEAKRPERDVPIGIILALTLGGILYVALTLCTVGVLRFDRLSDGAAMLDALGSVTQESHALLDRRVRRFGRQRDGHADVAARAGAHLLRHGARSHAAAGRRAHPSRLSHAGAHDDDHRRRSSRSSRRSCR